MSSGSQFGRRRPRRRTAESASGASLLQLGDRGVPQQQPLGAVGPEVDLGDRVGAAALDPDDHAEPVGVVGDPVSYTHLRAHETDSYLVCRLLLEKKNITTF